MSDNDFMEMGDSDLVPLPDGWYLEKSTGNKVDPDGNVFSPSGEMIWSSDLDEYDSDS